MHCNYLCNSQFISRFILLWWAFFFLSLTLGFIFLNHLIYIFAFINFRNNCSSFLFSIFFNEILRCLVWVNKMKHKCLKCQGNQGKTKYYPPKFFSTYVVVNFRKYICQKTAQKYTDCDEKLLKGTKEPRKLKGYCLFDQKWN